MTGDGVWPGAVVPRASGTVAADGDAGRRLGECAASWAGTRRVRVGPWEVRYREAGEGPALVMVHGLGCSADYWMRNGPVLAAAGFRVIAPDLPGFGRTDGPRLGLSIPEQAAAVAALSDALEVGRAAYLGHSLSCQTVIHLAATEPERVAALVAAAPTGDRRRKRMLREAAGFAADIPREPLDLVPFIADAYVRCGVVRWLGTYLAGKRHDTFGAAERTHAPALVLVGDRDPVVSPAFARAVADALPGGWCQVVEGAAHALIFDAPEAFNRAVVSFLRGLLASEKRADSDEDE